MKRTIKAVILHDTDKNIADLDFNHDGVLRPYGFVGTSFWDFATEVEITYEVEEPKIEITPSQLEKAMDNRGYSIDSFNELSRELFGELDE